ncbi:Phosphoribosyl-AMP cyclohydrolase [Candidatus Hodgkinia cicadicola]|uniref:phosphoribosyl-AMP cyclohydrolase n=1 Tax=Candidatus Hodgkinia cicadicola TaxID=573658 RepID=A0ABX4MF46_9HYPH|nr:Phosphoribosyl-AMP cyclohydrolase [Candidatus Hodgkinia cicadicola]PIM96900.1 Phosphoribosyl-AMP cyclohydrolase [Candidatus Hodgkinia cicadicola]
MNNLELNSSDLIPVVVIDFYSKEVIMFTYTNELCLRLTLVTHFCHYYNCAGQFIWLKGCESGNLHLIQEIYTDCYSSCLIFSILILQTGLICHTERPSCFYKLLK